LVIAAGCRELRRQTPKARQSPSNCLEINLSQYDLSCPRSCLAVPGKISGFPILFVTGYAENLGGIGIDLIDIPMDFHAWFEVFLNGDWHRFDARHRVPRVGRVLMACGRDAADTALTTAFGSVRLIRFKVHTHEVSEDHFNQPCRAA
jgi:transglutaminase-like putative cysteine protease